MNDIWTPLYETALRSYGLHLRPEVNINEVAWAFNACQSREAFERLADGLVATGAEFAHGDKAYTVSAGKEVILCAG